MVNEKNLTTIIIDDNDMIREVLRVMLRSDGYDVVGEAADGETGLELAFRLRPDIICLDVVMPKVSGIEVLKRIKEKSAKTVVMMVTGSSDRDTVHGALAAGANGFILKPFNTGKVLDTIEQAVAKASAQ
jgi:two-component system chemotaxis response regulator CheY